MSTNDNKTGATGRTPAHRYTAAMADEIETRWQRWWDDHGPFRAPNPGDPGFDPDKPKFYCLDMFPYPSGAGLHVGHPEGYTATDIISRYKRMRGFNVLHPMGWDAFGLPAEQYAVQTGVHPAETTRQSIETFRRQLKRFGFSYDWSREVSTCEPDYYRWNQWFFLKFYEKGLAYRQKAAVDWCPNCNTTLAREQVWGEDRHCERCGTPVVKRDLEQWFFRITAYADELLNFDGLDWPERVKTMQTNWIGRSEGAEIRFGLEGIVGADGIATFTTRPDTIYGVTFMVLAPEHPLVDTLTTPDRRAEVDAYIEQARRQTEILQETMAELFPINTKRSAVKDRLISTFL